MEAYQEIRMSPLPHALKRIRLHLARSRQFPEGSARHGYEFVAPLDRSGHIDVEMWKQYREHCGVRRFWGDDVDNGKLVHHPGSKGGVWMFDYREGEDDDEAGYRFASHPFLPGEYVSIRGEDGDMHTFKVALVEPAA
jgi:hypothetical protein